MILVQNLLQKSSLIKEHNARFAVEPLSLEDVHRKELLTMDVLDLIFSYHEKKEGAFHFMRGYHLTRTVVRLLFQMYFLMESHFQSDNTLVKIRDFLHQTKQNLSSFQLHKLKQSKPRIKFRIVDTALFILTIKKSI